MQWIQGLQQAHDLSAVIVGMEPTGHYWMNLAQYLRGQDILAVLVNPLHVKESKELDDNSPTKNDTKDAWVIAQLVKDGRYAVPLAPARDVPNRCHRVVHSIPDIGLSEFGNVCSHLWRIHSRGS